MVDSYNHYSNLSHFYADLACQNDNKYETVGGHEVECSYSEIKLSATKFCSSIRPRLYCLTDSHVGDDHVECQFEVPAKNEYYCDEGDSMNPEHRYECDHLYPQHNSYYSCDGGYEYWDEDNNKQCVYNNSIFPPKDLEIDDDGEESCESNYKKLRASYNGTEYKCYRSKNRTYHPASCDSGDSGPSNRQCTHTYRAHTYWMCETSYYQDEDEEKYPI